MISISISIVIIIIIIISSSSSSSWIVRYGADTVPCLTTNIVILTIQLLLSNVGSEIWRSVVLIACRAA